MTLFERLTQQAKANKQRIVLAEGAEKRTLTAADHLIADGICDITLIGNPAEIKQLAAELSLKNIEHATIVDPADETFTEKYAQLYYELRKAKGMTLEGAHKQVHNPLYLGCLHQERRCRRSGLWCVEHHRRRASCRFPDYQAQERHQRCFRRVPYAASRRFSLRD